MQIPPFNDVRVRKTFVVGSRQEMADKITQSGQIPASALTPAFAGYTPPKGYKEDEEQAKKLMAEAGSPGGKGFPKVTLLYNTSSTHKKIAEYWQQRFEQVLGVKIEVVNQEWATYLESRKDGKMGGFNMARRAAGSRTTGIHNFLFMFKPDNVDFNDTVGQPEYLELLNKAIAAAARGCKQALRRGRAPHRGRRGDHADLLHVSQNMINTARMESGGIESARFAQLQIIYKKWRADEARTGSAWAAPVFSGTDMTKYIIRRILRLIPTLLIIISLSFFIIRWPRADRSTERNLPKQVLENIMKKYHLDSRCGSSTSVPMGKVLRGDLGPSCGTGPGRELHLQEPAELHGARPCP
jgi:hypothetical protein